MPLNNPLQSLTVTTGSYTGDNSANRAIPHGGTGKPYLVIVSMMGNSDAYGGVIGLMFDDTYHRWSKTPGGANSSLSVTVMNTTNFYVGNATDYGNSFNSNSLVYHWIAFFVS